MADHIEAITDKGHAKWDQKTLHPITREQIAQRTQGTTKMRSLDEKATSLDEKVTSLDEKVTILVF